MGATKSSDWNFNPVVWKDHVEAYFDRKLVYGAFAYRDDELASEPGLTITFPYFKTIGDVEEPAEDEGLGVDNLSDDSFTATVKEVGKAVGIKKKAFKKSAASAERLTANAQSQIGRRMAEKIDKDLLTEFSTPGNYTDGFVASASGHTMSPARLLEAKIVGFGDRANTAVVCFLHSRQWLDLMRDTTAGFLQANAEDPLYLVEGFMGRLAGLALVVVDTVPNHGSTIGGAVAYDAYLHTADAYGIITKQDMEMEDDYDMLMREWVVSATQWYAVKSLHAKTDSQNVRTVRCATTIA